jgi:hypothetical protein
MATPADGWRVKLYELNDDGQWDDRGTGAISVQHLEALGAVGVQVSAEESGTPLLQSRILEDRDAYSLQGENIITWEERRPPPQQSIDLALSFQENEGCLEIWNRIQEVQGTFDAPREDEEEDNDEGVIGPQACPGAGGGGGLLRHHLGAELRELPECRVANLVTLRDQLVNAAPMHREAYAAMLLDKQCAYLQQLVALFGDCEDLEDGESLKTLAQTMKAVVLLNEGRLLEVLLGDESLFEASVGAIEYDPELKQKATWRHFLTSEARFREVVPMGEEHAELKAKIDSCFRAALLRDAVMRPGMDDNAVSGLVQYIYFATSEILSGLHHNSGYLQRVLVACTTGKAAGGGGGEEASGDNNEGSSSSAAAAAASEGDAASRINHSSEEKRPDGGDGGGGGGSREATGVVVVRSDTEQRSLALRFLQEMTGLAKTGNVPMQTRDALYSYLLSDEAPLFEALTASLGENDSLCTRDRLAASEVLASAVTFDQASAFRLFVINARGHPPTPAWFASSTSSSASSSSGGGGNNGGGSGGLATTAITRTDSLGASSDRTEEYLSPRANGAAAADATAVSKSSSGGDGSDWPPTSSSSSSPTPSPTHLAISSSCPPPPSRQSLLSLVLHRLSFDDDMGCLLHFNEILSKCIDTETMDSAERDAFLTVFYDHYIHWLVDPLMRDAAKLEEQQLNNNNNTGGTTGGSGEKTLENGSNGQSSTEKAAAASSASAEEGEASAATAAGDEMGGNGGTTPPSAARKSAVVGMVGGVGGVLALTESEKASRGFVADLLSYCVRCHTYRMKFFVLRNNLVARVLELLKQPDKFLKLSALRFLRACVGVKDDYLNRHLVKKDHFAPVFALFQANGSRDNLMSSAVIDIIDFIRTENIKRCAPIFELSLLAVTLSLLFSLPNVVLFSGV